MSVAAESQPRPTFVRLAEEWKTNTSVLQKAYSYDDILLEPQFSPLGSVDEVSTATELVRGFPLAIPIVSANMDSVTEARMGIFMARVGGIGIIHRTMSIDTQVDQIRAVKDAAKYVVQDPPFLHPNDSVAKAREVMAERRRGYVLVIDEHSGELMGLASTRDVGRMAPADAFLQNVMKTRDKLIVAPPGIGIEEAQQLMWDGRVEKLPLVDSEGVVHGVITESDINFQSQYPNATKDEKGRLRVGAAVGIQADAIERAQALIEAGVDILVVDVLHGDSQGVINMVRNLKKLSPSVPVMAGNVATPHATRRLIDVGVDSVKVGYGPGALCTTQRETGTGSQQFSAVVRSAAEAYGSGVTINADGGIRTGGDLVKAMTAADHVMIGTALAGTDESPGDVRFDDETGDRYKDVRGMASEDAQRDLAAARGGKAKKRSPQGVKAKVVYDGPAEPIVDRFIDGLKHGMANTGSLNLDEFRMNVVYSEQTSSGSREGNPHVRINARRR